ncbi:MAG TPA: GAP family protein, partial [Clostridia bacterium]|nr:GAP family protein [Clostridia bacterium]
KQWIFTLYAVGVIHETDLTRPENAIAFLMFVLGAQSLVLLPIGLYVFTPRHAIHFLETSTLWLERNNQKILTAVSSVFGAFFTFKGIAGLLR